MAPNMNNYQSIDIHHADECGGLGGFSEEFAPFHKNAIVDAADKDSLLYQRDHLVPPFDSDERPSSLVVGSFNLIATIIGGGVLSLPIVFDKCGVAFTTLAMMLSAYMTYMSLIMLCYCSRRGGGSSYGEVVRSAFGERMEEGVSWLLCVYLMLSIVAYMILARDVWTPLAGLVLRTDANGDYVLLAIMGLLLPFLFQRSLHALRKICYVGFASILVLCVALCRGGLKRLEEDVDDYGSDRFEIQWFKVPSPGNLLFSFPIITCAFLCHFNIIAIQNALKEPTRERMHGMVHYAIGACFVLMYMFGLGGYVYGGNETKGNILLNVPMSMQGVSAADYYLFLLGRIGCGITIMIAMPMNLLPCREALLEVVDVWFHDTHHRSDSNRDEQCCWRLFHRLNSYETLRDAEITTEDELFEIMSLTEAGHHGEGRDNECMHASSVLIRHSAIQKDYIFRNTLLHYGSTVLITAACYLGAVAVTGVAAVWSFIGSSMAFFVAFVLPCGCFVVIESSVPGAAEGGDRHDGWIRIAWAIMAFSLVGAVVCTVNNTIGLGFGR